MILAVDIGNTQTLFALFRGDDVVGQWRLASDPRRSADEFDFWMRQFLERSQIDASAVTQAVVASVVPQSTFSITKAIMQLCGCDPLHISSDVMQQIGLQIDMSQPQEVGADRLINALAAWEQVKNSAIVLDFGTATTFDVINEHGAYCGGVICPGINLSLDALHRAAAKLPTIGIAKPNKAIGGNTVEAMQAGIYYGYLGLIERVLTEIQQEMGGAPSVLATGGLGSLFAPATTMIQAYVPDLTLTGLRLTAQRFAKYKGIT